MQDTEFAVIDVETTGLFPEKHDRIIEIAVVRVDHFGTTLAEYATLVNPLRDIGPSYHHGITSRDVTNAPEFSEMPVMRSMRSLVRWSSHTTRILTSGF